MTTPLDRLAALIAGMSGAVSSEDLLLRMANHRFRGDAPFILANVAEELIAVARACEGLTHTPGYDEIKPVRKALDALNAKLETLS